MQDTEPTAPVEAHPEVERSEGAMMSASGDVWTTEGWCDLGTTSAGGGGGIAHSMTVWAKCWCDEGFEKVEDGEVDWQAGTWVGPTCACENGSSNEWCEPDVGDPEDPGDDEEIPGAPPPDSIDVQVVFDSAVIRGQIGGCEITKEPATLTLSNVEWAALVFDAEPSQSGGESWYGTIVTDTEFEVEGLVDGGGIQATSLFAFRVEVEVEPRDDQSWTWSPGNGITTQAGTMAFPSGSSDAIGIVCRPGEPCPVETGGWLVQPHENFAHQNGYVRQQVSSGPNEGLWYISDVTTDLHMVALMNPDYLPGGTEHPATGDDAVACGASSSDTVSVGFVDYNEDCRFEPNYLVPFETWVWDHETQHMTNAVAYIAGYEYPRRDIRHRLESIVRAFPSELDNDAEEILKDVPVCVQRAAGTHGHLGNILDPFPGIPDAIWTWGPTTQRFNEQPAGSTFWTGSGPDPFTSPCN